MEGKNTYDYLRDARDKCSRTEPRTRARILLLRNLSMDPLQRNNAYLCMFRRKNRDSCWKTILAPSILFSFFFSFFPINLVTSVANSCSTRRIPRCHDTFISSYHEKLEIEVVNRVSTRSKADDFFETFEFISLSNFSSPIFPRIVN